MGQVNHVWNSQHIFQLDLLRRKLRERDAEIERLAKECDRLRALAFRQAASCGSDKSET
jgi:hypothetical protein